MKWLGILFASIACFLIGQNMATQLKEQCQYLQCLKLLLLRIDREIRVSRLPTAVLLQRLAKESDFQPLGFLRKTAQRFTGKQPVSILWEEALEEETCLTKLPDTKSLIRELGGIIGESDWESQTSALTLVNERLDRQLDDAEQRYLTQGRLYRSLGILAGILFAILAL
ncbi:MAG: stage III sporulation protein AB [Candidatus Merdivicinus sp.]|jgi:stage III sporulation protein AB